MKHRGLLARIKAISGAKVASVMDVEPEKVGIEMLDPKTMLVVVTYDSLQEVIDDGYSRSNILGAIKKGTKYRDFLWKYVDK